MALIMFIVACKSSRFFPETRISSPWIDACVFSLAPLIALTIFCAISIIACIFCLSKAMNIIPVGFTYATYGGLTITAVTLFGVFKYNQMPNLYGIIGIALIVVGVILLNTLGKTT